MKARLLEDRPAYAKASDNRITVKAGEIVEIIRIEQFRDRMVAEYKGLYTLSLTPDQAEPMEEDEDEPMTDSFFTQTTCDRCGGSLDEGRIMSMFNEQAICMLCKEKERKRPDYAQAVEADHEQIRKGNYNYKGING